MQRGVTGAGTGKILAWRQCNLHKDTDREAISSQEPHRCSNPETRSGNFMFYHMLPFLFCSLFSCLVFAGQDEFRRFSATQACSRSEFPAFKGSFNLPKATASDLSETNLTRKILVITEHLHPKLQKVDSVMMLAPDEGSVFTTLCFLQ